MYSDITHEFKYLLEKENLNSCSVTVVQKLLVTLVLLELANTYEDRDNEVIDGYAHNQSRLPKSTN